MNLKNIILITGNDNFFGQTRKPWVSLNVSKMIRILKENGFEVKQYTFHQIVNQNIEIKNSIVFYTFSQKYNRRKYIKDVIYFLNNSTNTIIPCYDLLKCHENKGFQELYKRKLNIFSLKAFYLSSEKELKYYDINFPVILKSTEGSNAKAVFLAKDKQILVKQIRKMSKQNLFTKIDLIRRKYFRRKKKYREYPDYSNIKDYHEYKDYILNERNFILQEYVENLDYDFRVLILFDKYYVVKRHTHQNDFRASGTKKFDFDFECDVNILNYAKQIYQKIDNPFLSLDIGLQQNNCYLFEFQALHFGMSVLAKSKGFYQYIDEKWQFIVQESINLEAEITTALVKFIKTLN